MLIWTDKAVENITDFINGARVNTKDNARRYMNKLVEQVENLEKMPELGKNVENIYKELKLKQLIYKKHRIIYKIENYDVIIIAVLHTRLDLKRYFEEKDV